MTPGGGVEGDETLEEAAAREAAEALSVTGVRLTPLWSQAVEFSFRGETVRQLEGCFLLRLSSADVVADEAARKARHREGIVAARWWSLEEIEQAAEQVFPRDLGERLRTLQS